jgi:hypothetical protein
MTAQSQDGGAFERSLAELSRRLNERSLAFSPEQARAAAQARRAALQERDRARRPWLAVLFGAPLAAAIGVAAAWVIQPVDTPEASDAPLVAPLISTEARAEPPPPAAPSSPPPPASVVPAPEPSPSATASEPAAVADTPAASAPQTAPSSEAALPVIDVREVQAKLRAFGFEPGPVDGVTGRQTEAAVRRYQQSRSQPQTGKVDQELLDQLRRDPAPQVARHVAPRPAAADNRTVGPAVGPTVAAPARPQRQADPFEPVRSAGDRFGRWLESLVR